MRPVTRILTLAAALVLVAGCAPTGGGASGEPTDASAGAITVEVADTDAGPSLVGPDGRTLYIFTQDTEGTSTCADDCAAMWPPLEVEAGGTVEGGEGVTGQLAIIERDDGSSQVTYDGMPLYFFASDTGPGDAAGEGVGGVWFIASPEGQSGAQPSDDAAPTDDDMAEPSESAEATPDYGY
jgi:predicted lipoprotein with Yx(FWY)xxD motif